MKFLQQNKIVNFILYLLTKMMNDIHFTKLIYFVVNLNLRAME